MWPVEKMTIMTARPELAAFPIRDSAPLYFSFTIGAAVAQKIRMNVPTNSAPNFLVSETSGLGKSVKQVGEAALAHESNGKHLLQFGIDFLSYDNESILAADNRGPPGVPGVAGVDAAVGVPDSDSGIFYFILQIFVGFFSE